MKCPIESWDLSQINSSSFCKQHGVILICIVFKNDEVVGSIISVTHGDPWLNHAWYDDDDIVLKTEIVLYIKLKKLYKWTDIF